MAESAGHAGTYRAEPSTVASDLGHHHVMAAIIFGLFGALGSALRARGDLVLENLALRQQLAIFKHRDPRLRLTHPERLFWIALSRVWSRWREALVVVKPETVVGWHRWAFRGSGPGVLGTVSLVALPRAARCVT